MIYVLAFFFPFIALFVKGMHVQAIINGILWLIGLILVITFIFAFLGGFIWLICSIWAIIVIAQKTSKERHQEMLDALSQKS